MGLPFLFFPLGASSIVFIRCPAIYTAFRQTGRQRQRLLVLLLYTSTATLVVSTAEKDEVVQTWASLLKPVSTHEAQKQISAPLTFAGVPCRESPCR